jgi:hypothetical protein
MNPFETTSARVGPHTALVLSSEFRSKPRVTLLRSLMASTRKHHKMRSSNPDDNIMETVQDIFETVHDKEKTSNSPPYGINTMQIIDCHFSP